MIKTIVALITLGGFAIAGAWQQTQQAVRITPEDIKWSRDTDGSGVERATLFGDPSKPGLYVIRVKFPPGTMSLNHYHPDDRHVTVIRERGGQEPEVSSHPTKPSH